MRRGILRERSIDEIRTLFKLGGADAVCNMVIEDRLTLTKYYSRRSAQRQQWRKTKGNVNYIKPVKQARWYQEGGRG